MQFLKAYCAQIIFIGRYKIDNGASEKDSIYKHIPRGGFHILYFVFHLIERNYR